MQNRTPYQRGVNASEAPTGWQAIGSRDHPIMVPDEGNHSPRFPHNILNTPFGNEQNAGNDNGHGATSGGAALGGARLGGAASGGAPWSGAPLSGAASGGTPLGGANLRGTPVPSTNLESPFGRINLGNAIYRGVALPLGPAPIPNMGITGTSEDDVSVPCDECERVTFFLQRLNKWLQEQSDSSSGYESNDTDEGPYADVRPRRNRVRKAHAGTCFDRDELIPMPDHVRRANERKAQEKASNEAAGRHVCAQYTTNAGKEFEVIRLTSGYGGSSPKLAPQDSGPTPQGPDPMPAQGLGLNPSLAQGAGLNPSLVPNAMPAQGPGLNPSPGPTAMPFQGRGPQSSLRPRAMHSQGPVFNPSLGPSLMPLQGPSPKPSQVPGPMPSRVSGPTLPRLASLNTAQTSFGHSFRAGQDFAGDPSRRGHMAYTPQLARPPVQEQAPRVPLPTEPTPNRFVLEYKGRGPNNRKRAAGQAGTQNPRPAGGRKRRNKA